MPEPEPKSAGYVSAFADPTGLYGWKVLRGGDDSHIGYVLKTPHADKGFAAVPADTTSSLVEWGFTPAAAARSLGEALSVADEAPDTGADR